jgi:hypothetical protein
MPSPKLLSKRVEVLERDAEGLATVVNETMVYEPEA